MMNEWYKRIYSPNLIRPIATPMANATNPAGPGRRKTARRGHLTWFFLLCGLLLAMHTPVQAQDYLESQGIRFRLIPGGTYLLGSPPHEAGRYANEPTPHRATLKPFYLAVTETTNA
jgi:formylglycine-generating enzyme required for sulfatase activity